MTCRRVESNGAKESTSARFPLFAAFGANEWSSVDRNVVDYILISSFIVMVQKKQKWINWVEMSKQMCCKCGSNLAWKLQVGLENMSSGFQWKILSRNVANTELHMRPTLGWDVICLGKTASCVWELENVSRVRQLASQHVLKWVACRLGRFTGSCSTLVRNK